MTSYVSADSMEFLLIVYNGQIQLGGLGGNAPQNVIVSAISRHWGVLHPLGKPLLGLMMTCQMVFQ